jgi:hypothetical protein
VIIVIKNIALSFDKEAVLNHIEAVVALDAILKESAVSISLKNTNQRFTIISCKWKTAAYPIKKLYVSAE